MEEKKSVGKFISALRQAKGLTQKQLGDMLYVSNKTVSRWERDECLPDLNLIPAIAEIFDITSDELLRGERSRPEGSANPAPARLHGRAGKRALAMIERRLKQFCLYSAISAALALAGIAAAAILNSVFYEGLIGFFVSLACCICSAVAELCLAIGLSLGRAEEFSDISARMHTIQNVMTRTAAAIISADMCIIAFCLPLGIFVWGLGLRLAADSWIVWGIDMAFCTGTIIFAVYGIFIRPALTRRGALYFPPDREAWKESCRGVLVRTAFVGGIILALAAVTLIISLILNLPHFSRTISLLCILADCITCIIVYNIIIAVRRGRKMGVDKKIK